MTKRPALQQAVTKTPLITFVILIILLFLVPTVSAQDDTRVEYFYENGCSKCQKIAPVIENVVDNSENINYSSYEISTSYNQMKEYGVYTVPVLVINESTKITYQDYKGNITLFKELLIESIKNAPPLQTSDDTDNNSTITKPPLKISPVMVLIAGILAGFNPCLLAVMAFMASVTLTSEGNRRDMLTIVAGFCAGIFITYTVVGMGILKTINSMPEIHETITLFMVTLIGGLGAWHIYDAYYMKTRDKSTFKTPKSLISFMGNIKGKNILMLSLFAGGLFSLVKAPCVGAVYLSILDMMMTRVEVVEGTLYLAVYNFGVVFPVFILGGLLAFGLNPDTVTEFREKRRSEIRLITGVVLIILAILLNFNVI
ncbi:cytochrome c biogenesis protein transmembrane region [Methanohalobium evestigatum Z-7303]|uniref:Cytochrome c biogenesis protein transmembrane region n=1 Tax=Methanohalobium evestigatum (strain ATCC BAA-1072 / DSM 3721 / NBRC 107634 / OCM 161 / Z-7303) TaxID=644295 RepID=D7E968_METEZ|nr:cytochrome c biogenesis protein [Methanohalobium evestigatum]ADI74016.1 cytochrome c biogenesis protein transmembrane region [Methanohalobium evestigatum Z-7303]